MVERVRRRADEYAEVDIDKELALVYACLDFDRKVADSGRLTGSFLVTTCYQNVAGERRSLATCN